jgi:hypothetical protein
MNVKGTGLLHLGQHLFGFLPLQVEACFGCLLVGGIVQGRLPVGFKSR